MIYGGSQVFSAGTGSLSWPERVENQLHEAGLENVQVINAGTPGHASFDSLGRFFSFGHFLNPDIVVLNNQWNDIKYFHVQKHPLTRVKPYEPSSNPRRNYLNSLDRFFGNQSQFYLQLRQAYFGWGTNPRRRQAFYSDKKRQQVYREPLLQYSLTVETFINVARTSGAEPVLMRQPRLLAADLSDTNMRKIRFESQNLTPQATLRAYKMTDQILTNISENTNVPLLEFSGMHGKGRYFYDHVHLTPTGAGELSVRFARKLLTQIIDDRHDNDGKTR
jgi:hypothetical protein